MEHQDGFTGMSRGKGTKYPRVLTYKLPSCTVLVGRQLFVECVMVLLFPVLHLRRLLSLIRTLSFLPSVFFSCSKVYRLSYFYNFQSTLSVVMKRINQSILNKIVSMRIPKLLCRARETIEPPFPVSTQRDAGGKQ